MNKPAHKKIQIAPSILSADFARLGEEVAAITKAGADMVHVDVMDGHFVPNLTIGPAVVKALRPHTKLPLDVHLMISCLDLVPEFVKAGADIITIHAEASPHLDRGLEQIRSLGVKAGVSLCPSTHESCLNYVMDKVDLILLMTVNPGFGGQNFLPSQLRKIQTVRGMISNTRHKVLLEVDGGINEDTSKQVIAAGADVLVAGSAIFTGDADEYAANIKALRA